MFRKKDSAASVLDNGGDTVPATVTNPEVLTSVEVAALLKRFDAKGKPDVAWINEKCRASCRNPLPVRKDGKYRFFLRHEVVAWLLSPDRLVRRDV